MPPFPPFHPIIEILIFIFHWSWCTIIKQVFRNQKVAKNIKKISPHIISWCHENIKWCWKFYGGARKLKRWCCTILTLGHRQLCSRYIFSKLAKILTLEKRKRSFSKVLRIQDGQEYLSLKMLVIPISSNISHHIIQPCDHNRPLSAAAFRNGVIAIPFLKFSLVPRCLHFETDPERPCITKA